MRNNIVSLGKHTYIYTGKLDANASSQSGEYPFFTCSREPLKINSYSYDCECVLVAGNGDLNVKYYNGKFDAYQRTYIIESTDKEILSVKYLFYFLDKYIEKLREQAIGGVIKYIKLGYLTEAYLPLPSIEAQTKIVSRLDKANSLIDLRRQQLEKLELLIKSKFIDMFGDPVKNPNEWPIVSIMETGSFKNGMNFRSNDFGVEIHCLGVGDFKDLSVIENTHNLPTISLNEMPTSEYLLQDGDIVFVRSNGNKALVGRCLAMYPGKIPTTYSGFCIRYRKSVDTLFTKYLLQVFKAPSMREKIAGRGANIQNLNQQILSQMNIPVPPIELQNQFAEFVEQVEKQKAVMQQSLEKMETNYKALMQEYFG